MIAKTACAKYNKFMHSSMLLRITYCLCVTPKYLLGNWFSRGGYEFDLSVFVYFFSFDWLLVN